MITKFKIFENNNDASLYIGKFYIMPAFMREYDFVKKYCYVCLVTDVDFHYMNGNKNKIWPHGEVFSIMKNDEVSEPGGNVHMCTLEEFQEIYFMTPDEFFNNNKEMCKNIYLKVLKESNLKHAPWYDDMIEKYISSLKTVKELQYIVDSEKYNL